MTYLYPLVPALALFLGAVAGWDAVKQLRDPWSFSLRRLYRWIQLPGLTVAVCGAPLVFPDPGPWFLGHVLAASFVVGVVGGVLLYWIIGDVLLYWIRASARPAGPSDGWWARWEVYLRVVSGWEVLAAAVLVADWFWPRPLHEVAVVAAGGVAALLLPVLISWAGAWRDHKRPPVTLHDPEVFVGIAVVLVTALSWLVLRSVAGHDKPVLVVTLLMMLISLATVGALFNTYLAAMPPVSGAEESVVGCRCRTADGRRPAGRGPGTAGRFDREYRLAFVFAGLLALPAVTFHVFLGGAALRLVVLWLGRTQTTLPPASLGRTVKQLWRRCRRRPLACTCQPAAVPVAS